MIGRPLEILLVEDNPADVRLTKEALREGKIVNRFVHVKDGAEALAYLYGEGEYAGRTKPDLVLLDLNLPKKSGREVLEKIKNDEEFKAIPVIILTTSTDPEDIESCYANYANSYISKPGDLNSFIEVLRGIENFWLSIVTLPDSDVD